MAFSGALTITDLDDFLTPSQACIIPVRNPKGSSVANEGSTEIHIDADNTYYEVSTYSTTAAGPSVPKAKQALEKAEINLNDCLACSGCITSTESILITMQSHNEVLDFISRSSPSTLSNGSSDASAEKRTPILSISPQTLASLSAAYSSASSRPPIPLLTLLRRIRHFLRDPRRGGWRVWDTTFSRHMSLLESKREFDERSKGKAKDTPPILASACPGWVCYAEKAQGEMLPMLSAVRSAQGIMGALVKQWWATQMDLNPDQVYHVTAMPCYDKKLEASRSDFYSAMYNTRDVDCVLTTGELDLLLQDLAFDPYAATVEEVEVETEVGGWGSPFPELLTPEGSSSGSYLQTILSHVAAAHPKTHLTVRPVRDSPDNVEYILSDADTGEALFKGAKVYGFRNLQNLVRKVQKETGLSKRPAGAAKLSAQVAARRRKARTTAVEISTPATPGSPGAPNGHAEDISLAMRRLQNEEEKKLDYVEVMACPGGCVNGGGQMKPAKVVDEEGYERPIQVDGVEEGMRWSTKEWVGRVEEIYWTGGLPTPPTTPPMAPSAHREEVKEKEADTLAERIISEVSSGDSNARWEFLRTRFRKVEGDILNGGVTLDAVKW